MIRKPELYYFDSRMLDGKQIGEYLKANANQKDFFLIRPVSEADSLVFRSYLQFYGFKQWIQAYHKIDQNFNTLKEPSFTGDIYAITIDMKKEEK